MQARECCNAGNRSEAALRGLLELLLPFSHLGSAAHAVNLSRHATTRFCREQKPSRIHNVAAALGIPNEFDPHGESVLICRVAKPTGQPAR